MIKIINSVSRKLFFPFSLKILNLIIFFVLIYFGIQAYSEDPAFIKELRNTNLGNLIVWSVWWPIIILLSVLFGRIWCMMCPVETVTSFFSKIGFKFTRPRFILSGWFIVIFYALILLIGIQGFAIHRNPYYMAVYMMIIFVSSIVVGIIFEKNTFCRCFCPIGYLLGIYSRFSFMGWRVKKQHICETCKDKSCIEKKYLYSYLDKSCGVDLYPAKINDNVDCILCTGCLKTCNNYMTNNVAERPNPGFVKTGFAKGILNSSPLRTAEMVFLVIVSGFVISEILSEWTITNQYLNFFPDRIKQAYDLRNFILKGLNYGVIIFIILPLIIWLIPIFFAKIFGNKLKLSEYMVNYGLAFIPIVAAAHIGKSLLKLTSRIPYFEHLPADYGGMITAKMILNKEIYLSTNPDWLNNVVSFLLLVAISGGTYYSFLLIRNINKKFIENKANGFFYLIPVLYGSIFLAMILFWRY